MLLAVLAAPAPAAPAAAGVCPVSLVELGSYLPGPLPVDAISYDSTYVNGDGSSTARVTFDRNEATLSVDAASSGGLTARVRVIEYIDVLGAAPGTPVNATLVLALDGWSQQSCGGSGCGVELEARLVAGSDSVSADATQFGPGGTRRDLVTTLTLPVTIVAGTPLEAQFFMGYGTGPGGDAEGSLSGHYGVSGLGGGLDAVTCTGTTITPVRRTTWGALKRIYH